MAMERIFTFSPLAVHNFFMRERNQWSDFKGFNHPWPCYTNNSNFGQESWYSMREIKIWNNADILTLAGLQRITGPGGSLLNLMIYCTEVNHLYASYWTKFGTHNEYSKEAERK